MAFESMKNIFNGLLTYFGGVASDNNYIPYANMVPAEDMRSSRLPCPQNPNIGPDGSSVDPEFLDLNESVGPAADGALADASPAHITPLAGCSEAATADEKLSPKPQSIPGHSSWQRD